MNLNPPLHDNRASRDAIISRIAAPWDDLIIDKGALPSKMVRVPLEKTGFRVVNDFSRADCMVWMPADSVGLHQTNVSFVRIADDISGSEFVFFEIPTGPVSIKVGGSGHAFCFMSKLHFAAEFFLFRSSSVFIGQGSTSGGVKVFCGNSDVSIGKDALLSDDIILQASDQHGVVDILSMEIVNGARSHIALDPHVWVGRRVMVTKNVNVGRGAILAGGSVVTKSVKPMTAVGGNPAKVVRQNVSWSRFPDAINDRDRQMIVG